jgi:DNA-binding MarR family transcriptional regulator
MVTKSQENNRAALLDTALSRLMLASVMMADDIERGLAERGLTRARATALWEILHREPVTQRELADALKVTPRNVTTLVDAMEKTGFVKRTDHPSDRRATIVALTSKGRKAVSRMKVEKQAFAEALFGGLDASELQHFVSTLDRVIGRLEPLLSTPASSTSSAV